MKNLIYLPLNYEFFYLDKTDRMLQEGKIRRVLFIYHSFRVSENVQIPINVTIRDDALPKTIQLCAVYVCSW